MANQHKHPTRGIRGVPTPVWEDYAAAVAKAGTDLSTPIRQFIDWYRGAPDAELPQRPGAAPDGGGDEPGNGTQTRPAAQTT